MPYLFRAIVETARRRRRTIHPADMWSQARAAIEIGDPMDAVEALILIAQDGNRAIRRQRGRADPTLLQVTDAVMSATVARLNRAGHPFKEAFASIAVSFSAALADIRASHVYDREEAARLLRELEH